MINVKNIIQQGQEAKYQVTIEHEGFSMTEGIFRIILSWGMRGETLTIERADMIQNEDGETFFTFPTNSMAGRVTAECQYDVADTDCPDGFRTEVERQPLCYVSTTARIPIDDDAGLYQAQHVSYVRRSRSSLRTVFQYFICRGGQYLADVHRLPFFVRKNN